MDAGPFLKFVKEKAKFVEMDPAFLNRSVNEGFSGGEKKRNEILQLAVLEPKLALLDETDSGLDIDALKIVANGINKLRDPKRAVVLVTHYQRLLDYIVPDFVHVLSGGRIVKSGDKSLALELEAGLSEAGAKVVGSAADVEEGLRMAELPLDAAVLDANLNGQSVLPVAQALAALGVPFIFATGYGDSKFAPQGFDAPLIKKPYDVTQVAAALA